MGASHCGGLSCGAEVLEHVLGSCGHGLSCYVICGIFLDQGLNPSSLHWKVDS